MGPIALFSIATLIWGSTWLAITFQLGVVSPEASVVYRFALAAILLGAWCLATGRSMRFPMVQHGWFAAQGTFLFGLNYLCVYWAERYVASGLVAVMFSLIVFLNLIGVRVFFATPVNRRTLAGATLGVTGVVALFWRDFSAGQADAALGVLFGVGGTVFASIGNMLAVRSQRRTVPLLPGVAWAMGYGALVIALVAELDGATWSFEATPRYVLSLLYLAVLSSVVAVAIKKKHSGRIVCVSAG